jgi:hypothetical protein
MDISDHSLNMNPAAAPVYAVVDKSKKTNPPPENGATGDVYAVVDKKKAPSAPKPATKPKAKKKQGKGKKKGDDGGKEVHPSREKPVM